MFVITIYSVLTAWLVGHFFLILFICLSKSYKIMLQTSLKIFVIIGILLLIRVFIPVEFGFTNAIVSYEIYPTILAILHQPLINCGLYHIELKTILFFIWFIVALFLLYCRIQCYRSYVKKISSLSIKCEKKYERILEDVKETNHYQFPTLLIVNNSIDSIMEFGFFRQTILLPDVSYSEEELKYIFHHELEHFANKTNWIKLFLTILEVLFWWNPFVYLFKNAGAHLLEIYCDTCISKHFSMHEKLEYLECLLQEAKREYAMRAEKKSDPISNFSFGSQLKQRFYVLLEGRKNKLLEFVICFMVLLIFVLSYSIVIQPGYQPPFTDFNEIIKQGYDIKYENEKYVVYVENEPFATFETKEIMERVGFV